MLTLEQRKMKQRFDTAKSATELLEAFTRMELCFKEPDLAQPYCTLLEKLHHKYGESENALLYGKTALNVLLNYGDDSLTGNALWVLGSSCSKLKRFNESCKYLSWAVRLLEKLKGTASSSGFIHKILLNLHNLNNQLYGVKCAVGMNDEGLPYLIKNLEITEKISGLHSKALANANKEVCDRYLEQMNQEAALRYCLRALEIYLACPGDNSDKIAECSKQLGLIYIVLGEPEKALQHNQLSRKLWKKLGCTSDSLSAEIDAALILTELGRFEEAVQELRDIVSRAEKDGMDQIAALTELSRTLCKQGKFDDAKACLTIVCGILDKKMDRTIGVGMKFLCVAEVYERMNDLENSITTLQKAIVIVQEEKTGSVSQKNPILEKISGRLVQLLVSAGKFEEAIPYLEVKVESDTKNFGFWHVDVGRAYNAVGLVYLHTNKLQLACETLAYAKHIFEKFLGSDDEESVTMVKALWHTQKAMGSSSVAITFLEERIKGLELFGPNSQDKATILRAELKDITYCERVFPYIEVKIEKAIKQFGSRHVKVGEAYYTLGAAYFRAAKLQLAAENFAYAKDILDKYPVNHEDSITLGENLSFTYNVMGSSSVAITFLEERIKSLELLGINAQDDELDKVSILKAELKKITCDEAMNSQSVTLPDTNKAPITLKVILLDGGLKVQPTTSIYAKSWNPLTLRRF